MAFGCMTISLSYRSKVILPWIFTHMPGEMPLKIGFALSFSMNWLMRTELV